MSEESESRAPKVRIAGGQPPAYTGGLKLVSGPGGRTACATPVALPPGGHVPGTPFNVSLASATTAASIEYQVRRLGEGPGEHWRPYTDAVSFPGEGTLYAHAVRTGLMPSDVMREDYWREDGSPPAGVHSKLDPQK